MRARAHVLAVLVLLVAVAWPAAARADGDPGSDVLVYQSLFINSDAGVSVPAQVRLGATLARSAKAGAPVRVAIIATPADLGSIGALWRRPQAYARFLGLELSLSYTGRLIVVMPNGLGFNWPGHSGAGALAALRGLRPAPGADGLAAAAQTAVTRVLASSGVTLSAAPAARGAPAASAPASSAPQTSGQHDDTVVTLVVLALALLAGAGWGTRWLLRRRAPAREPVAPDASAAVATPATAPRRRARLRLAGAGAAVMLVAAVAIVLVAVGGQPTGSQSAYLASNPNLDPGTPVGRMAGDFTLTDQFGQPVSLHSFRGKVVVLAFNDSECTTICPLTTAAMLQAKAMLGRSADQVQLLGIDANPSATSVQDVLSYSQLHGMTTAWHFLTGSLAQLRAVWKAYSIDIEINRKQVDHSPAVFVVDTHGRLARLYVTQQSYAAVGQFGQVLAREIAGLLPAHPKVRSDLSYAEIQGISPSTPTTLATTAGPSLTLGPSGAAHLYVFFATWAQEVTSLGPQLQALNAYQSEAARKGLPSLTAVDETSVEPSTAAVQRFLHGLSAPLGYPVALDRTGRVADGYGVQGEPWFVLVSPGGQVLWYWSVIDSGWLSRSALVGQVAAALSRAPAGPSGSAATARALAGSPPALAALHDQAGRILAGSESGLAARIKALRGYPVVVNAWASWCGPCKAEFGLFASAAARYGRRVAFLGANTNDSASDAEAFMAQHPISYPSYETTTSSLNPFAVIIGLPTTFFIDPQGKVTFVHSGQYDVQGSLDGDIERYALGR